MSVYKSQSGFSHIVLMLLIAVIAGLGFAGWRVYDSRYQKSNWADVTVPLDSPERQTATVIPEGFVEYKNEDLGFMFAYPKEWGEVSVEKVEGHKSTKSYFQNLKYDGIKQINLNFSNQKDISGALRSYKYAATHLKESPTNVIVSYCKQNNAYLPSFSKTVPGEDILIGDSSMNTESAVGQEQCALDSSYNFEAVEPVGANAIFIPSVCNERHGCQNGSIETILIVKTELNEFSGLKLIAQSRSFNEVLKQIAPTYKKL